MTVTQWMILPLRRVVDFRGRSCRAEFWWFLLFCALAGILASRLDLLIFGPAVVTRHISMVGGIPVIVSQTSIRFIGTALSLALLCPQVAVGIRQIHDVDHTAWWAVLPIALASMASFGVAAGRLLDLGALAGLTTVITAISVAAAVFAAIVLIVWQCTRGIDGPNRFGPDPLADLVVY
jgi:uncharacterized membrane protein YhaH (DUF805 family)